MDENSNETKKSSGLFSNTNKKGIKKLIRRIPINIRIMIIFGAIGLFLVIIIFAAFMTMIPINHLFFSSDASKDNYTIDKAYADFIENPCEEDDEKCSDRQKANYAKLKKDQEKFLKKLDSVSNHYNLSKEQKYIILTTIFYGNDENFFYEKTDEADAEFTLTSGAYTLDEDETGDVEDERDLEGTAYSEEKDTIKELAKQFSYYPVNCSYTVEKEVNGQIVKETVTEELKNGDETFTFGFWEHLIKKSNAEGFDEAKKACQAKPDGKVTSGSKVSGQAGGEAGINKYYEYLETNKFLDKRDVFQRTFFTPYFQAKKLDKWDEESLIEVRSGITDSIQKIVEAKLYLDQKYGIDDECGPNGASSGTPGNDASFWWPLTDEEQGGFAVGESSVKKYRDFGMRLHPIRKVWKLHTGMDISAPYNTKVIASKSGTVVKAFYGCEGKDSCSCDNHSGGNYVKIQHDNGYMTVYMHLLNLNVKEGDTVKQGQVIGLSASTGCSTGPHLHFEVRSNGQPVNPRDFVDPDNQRPGSTLNTTNLENSLNSSDESLNTTPVVNYNGFKDIKAHFLMNARFANTVTMLENGDSGGYVDIESLKSTANTNKGANKTPVDAETLAAYTSTVDIWTNLSDPILKAAGVDRNGNQIGGGVTFHSKGYCQGYVRRVYQAAGLGAGGFPSAIAAASSRTVSKSLAAIPVGAAVYGRSSSVYGHVGIYIGNGKVIHNVGAIKIDDLKYWATRYKWIGWGWENSEEKLTTASASGPVSLDSTAKGVQCITANTGGDGSVIVGNDNQQTLCLTLKNNNFSNTAIAGILGNVERESNFKSDAKNYLGCIGLFQFCPSGDKPGYLSKYGDAWSDPNNQIDYMVKLITVTPGISKKTGDIMKANPTADAETMAYTYCKYYERPEKGECEKRKKYGNKYVSYVDNNCGGAQVVRTVNNNQPNNQNISKKIFVGDSRTVGMQTAVGTNDVWSAKIGAGYKWMASEGIPKIEGQISQGSAVIILMGVNDLAANSYADYINSHANSWIAKGASVYFVSVNPVIDGKSNATTAKVENFNAVIKSKLNSNVKYIDTYSQIKSNFSSPDGLHYTNETYKRIYDIISSNL